MDVIGSMARQGRGGDEESRVRSTREGRESAGKVTSTGRRAGLGRGIIH